MPCLLPPPSMGNRGGGHRASAALGRQPWASGMIGVRGERVRAMRGVRFPGRSSAQGGPRWPGPDGRRQRATVALGRRLRGVVAVMDVGESTGGLRGVDYPAHLGQG